MGEPLGGISYLTFKDKIVTIKDWMAGTVLWCADSQKLLSQSGQKTENLDY